MDRCLTRLRELNNDFTTLATQTTKLLEATSSQSLTVKSVPVVKQCQRIRHASIELYEALGIACSAHSELQAHLQHKQALCGQDQVLDQSHIRFCVGLAQICEGRRAIFAPSTWFAVRTVLKSISALESTGVSCYFGKGMEEVSRLGQAL